LKAYFFSSLNSEFKTFSPVHIELLGGCTAIATRQEMQLIGKTAMVADPSPNPNLYQNDHPGSGSSNNKINKYLLSIPYNFYRP